ncbi:MAG: hypothetical protein V4649_07885 [Bacteroidota bacterium]
MSFRIRLLLCAVLFFSFGAASYAQQEEPVDYLRHMKYFHLCSYKKECSNCYSCPRQRYRVKIKNMTEKRVVGVSYVYYSEVYAQLMCKDAVMDSRDIDPKEEQFLFVCIPDARHWAISQLTYADGTSTRFVVKDRLTTFDQEADECDCNPQTHIKPPLN